jgi:hypothetical protein
VPTDRVDIGPSASSRSASRNFLTICSGECLFPFNRVTSSPIRAIVTLTTAGPDSGGHVRCAEQPPPPKDGGECERRRPADQRPVEIEERCGSTRRARVSALRQRTRSLCVCAHDDGSRFGGSARR